MKEPMAQELKAHERIPDVEFDRLVEGIIHENKELLTKLAKV